MNPKKCADYVIDLCNKLGLKLEETKKLYALLTEYRELGGKLKQIFINSEYVDKISYISQRSGHPYKQLKNDPLNKIFSGQEGNKPLTLENVISLLRTDPNNKALHTVSLTHDKYIDQLQARLLHFSKPFFDPEEAKKYGLEIFYSFAQEGAREKKEELSKQMDSLVKNLLWEALEKKTLKGGGEKTKLAVLYNTGKIKQKEDLQIEKLKEQTN